MFFNQKGYALVTVLLTITIFMVLAFSFMGLTVNSAKQNNVVEERAQSVALAEMGTQIYRETLKYELEGLKLKIQEAVDDYLEKETNKGNHISIENLRQTAINEAKKILEKHTYSTLVKEFKNDGNVTFRYHIENPKFYNSMLTFQSIGSVNGGEKVTISSTFYIDFDDITVSLVNGDTVDWFELIAPDEKFNTCAKDEKDFTNKRCKYDEKIFHNKEKQSLTFNGSQLKVNGELVFPNFNSSLGNSIFYVSGDFDNNNNLNSASDYTLYVKGKVNLGNLNNAKNVKVCANTVSSIGQMNWKSDVKIYAKHNQTGNSNVNTEQVAFNKHCMGGSSSSASSTNLYWHEPVIKEEFNYEY